MNCPDPEPIPIGSFQVAFMVNDLLLLEEAVAIDPSRYLSMVTCTIVGGVEVAAVYVKRSAELVALVPPAVVTVTSTIPAACAGETAVTVVLLTFVRLAAVVVPNLTAVVAVNPVPVIVTVVPPVAGPVVGDIEVTIGLVGVGVV